MDMEEYYRDVNSAQEDLLKVSLMLLWLRLGAADISDVACQACISNSFLTDSVPLS